MQISDIALCGVLHISMKREHYNIRCGLFSRGVYVPAPLYCRTVDDDLIVMELLKFATLYIPTIEGATYTNVNFITSTTLD